MRSLAPLLLTSLCVLNACSIFDSSNDKTPLPGERISILDLQQELRPSDNKTVLHNIDVPQATLNKDWAQSGGNANHNMQNPSLGGRDQIEKIWSADIGEGSEGNLPLTAQPIVADGKVFTLDTHSSVRAFHNQTGKQIWNTSVRHRVEKDPVISGGLAYSGGVLFITSGYDEVLALNPDSGEIFWRTKISAGSRAAPTVHNGRVFVIGLNNNAMALDARDGKVLWEYEGVGETTGLLGASSPAVDDNIVIAAFSSGDLVALHVENGAVVWSDSLANSLRLGGMAGLSDIRGLPVLNGEMVLAVSFGGKMAALDKRNGNRVWQREISSAETPWVAGNSVYVLTADYKLVALDLSSGEILWLTEIDKYEKPDSRKGLLTWAGPIMAGNRLILSGTDGRMVEFDPKTGEKSDTWSVKSTVNISPVVADGAIYLLGEDGRLLAYR